MCYIGWFIMKSIKENINSKEFKNGMYRYILKKKEVSLGQKPERKNQQEYVEINSYAVGLPSSGRTCLSNW